LRYLIHKVDDDEKFECYCNADADNLSHFEVNEVACSEMNCGTERSKAILTFCCHKPELKVSFVQETNECLARDCS
jgi:hypothetical protein